MDGLSDVGPTRGSEHATGADGKVIKMEEDFSERVEAALPVARTAAKKSLSSALEPLYGLEKGTRLGGDAASNRRLLCEIVKLCREANDWEALNENLTGLAKKRSLIKGSVSKMVELACGWVDEAPAGRVQLALIDTLRAVTAGKIYVEVERARLTYKLVKMREAEKKVDEAAKLLLELQVETFGSMDKTEKVELLLEQMRLCLARSDFIRAQIISRKISIRFFEEKDTTVQEMKIRYYRLMIQLDEHDGNFLAISRHYMALFRTPSVQADKSKLEECLKSGLLFCLLAPHGNEQWDCLQRIKTERALERLSSYRDLAELMTTEEMVGWKAQIEGRLEKLLRSDAAAVFTGAAGAKHWEVFQTRVGEHNIRIIAKYYTRISLARMAELLAWTPAKTEEFPLPARRRRNHPRRQARPPGRHRRLQAPARSHRPPRQLGHQPLLPHGPSQQGLTPHTQGGDGAQTPPRQ